MHVKDDNGRDSHAEEVGRIDRASLCVLASGSAGNCSVIALCRGTMHRLCLIDLGLSPRRTFRTLHSLGLRPDQIDDALITHLDSDHFRMTWVRALPAHTRLRMHRRHAEVAQQMGVPAERITTFEDEPFAIARAVTVRPTLLSHDHLGVAAFRVDLEEAQGSLGFATDVGRVTPRLIEHLSGDGGDGPAGRAVGVLAIESNYCPVMQRASGRPEYLKRRIMGGTGHLSNQQAAQAIQEIAPSHHVVLLHLSRQCNNPDLVADLHAGAAYKVTISSQFRPTRWVRLTLGERAAPRLVVAPGLWSRLFDAVTGHPGRRRSAARA